eukprot:37144-Eustigmatos_ZCMA.PRE.2
MMTRQNAIISSNHDVMQDAARQRGHTTALEVGRASSGVMALLLRPHIWAPSNFRLCHRLLDPLAHTRVPFLLDL